MIHIETHAKSTPKDVFLHLLTIAALYTSTVNFITLLFSYIDNILPDILNPNYGFDSIRWSISSLIILFPVFIFCSWLIAKDVKQDPAKRHIKIRKWLVYLTLFIAAIVIIGDLVTLIYNFLGGDLTARFILKILTVLVTASAIFGYYIWDLKHEGKDRAGIAKYSAIGAGIAVGLAIIIGFFIAGSPFEQRLRRIDESRVSDLQMIQNQIIYNYWPSKSKLPASLADLRDNISGFREPADPETQQPYEYKVKGTLMFELCATFDTASSGTTNGKSYPVPAVYYTGPYGENYDNWNHSAGRTCFERTIDPEIYRPKPQVIQ